MRPSIQPGAGSVRRPERAFVRALDGGCSTPTAAYAELEGGEVILRTFYVAPDGRQIKRKAAAPIAEAEALGIRLAKETLLGAEW